MSNSPHHIVVIAQNGCPPCEVIKDFFEQKGVEFDVIYLGNGPNEMSPELFRILWPDSKGTPHTLIDQRVCHDPFAFFDLNF